MTSRRWRVGQCASGADQPLALTALNQLQPTYVRCQASRAGSQTACDQGRNVAEYLAVLPSRDARVIARVLGKLCVLDLRLDQKIDGASGCLHSCMHCGEVRYHGLACTAVLLGCTI
jgi:hypothetical protein